MMQTDSRQETTKRAHSVNETIYPSLLSRMLSDISHFLFFFSYPFLKKISWSLFFLWFSLLQLVFYLAKCQTNWVYELLVHSRERQIIHTHICSETWYPVKFKLKQQCPNPQSQEIRPLDRETKRDKSLRTHLWPIYWEYVETQGVQQYFSFQEKEQTHLRVSVLMTF